MVLPWEQLRLVLALARHGTLAGAARALGTSPGAVEAELKRVERSAGATLFVRENGRLLPTDSGRSATRTGERLGEEMARVDRAIPRVPSGAPVRVRVEEGLAARWLETAAADVARMLGPITLELVTGRASRRQDVDLELTSQKPAAHGEPPRLLGLTADALFASQAYLLDHGRPSLSSQRLEGHRVVLLVGALARTDAGRWLLEASRNGARVALRTDSFPVFLSAVHAGVGLGVLPRGSEELAPELVGLGALPELPPRTVWLGFRGAGRPSQRSRRAAEVLERTLAAAMRRWER